MGKSWSGECLEVSHPCESSSFSESTTRTPLEGTIEAPILPSEPIIQIDSAGQPNLLQDELTRKALRKGAMFSSVPSSHVPAVSSTAVPTATVQVDTKAGSGNPLKIEAPMKEGTLEFRIRLLNFNMGNNSNFSSVDDLHLLRGFSFSQTLREPFADRRPVDIMYTTLVETRLNITEWSQEIMETHKGSGLNEMITQNARRECKHNTRSKIRSFAERLGAQYNGNLKSLLAFDGTRFAEDRSAVLFGRLTEAKIAGISVPNPKKAFMGKSLEVSTDDDSEGLRICFISAHFPIARLASVLEQRKDDTDITTECKIVFAATLRRLLKKACDRGFIDDRTLLIVQGDLNSRTVLESIDEEPKDVLLELLNDSEMQAALIHNLPVPNGRWREPVVSSVEKLPVTYKFQEHVGANTKALTVGRVLEQARADGDASQKVETEPKSPLKEPSTYKRTLTNIGAGTLDDWGLAFKKSDFRSFRFPASADRVIYWAADSLAERLEWQFPHGGYEVNYSQLGSDHRPVALHALLKVDAPPPSERGSLHSNDDDCPKPSCASVLNVAFEDTMRRNPRLRDKYVAISLEDDVESDGEDANYSSEAFDTSVPLGTPHSLASPVSRQSYSSWDGSSQADSIARRPHRLMAAASASGEHAISEPSTPGLMKSCSTGSVDSHVQKEIQK